MIGSTAYIPWRGDVVWIDLDPQKGPEQRGHRPAVVLSRSDYKLNPIERLWQDLKTKLFTQTYQTIEDMQAKVTEILDKYSDAAVAKLTGFSRFINAANAI